MVMDVEYRSPEKINGSRLFTKLCTFGLPADSGTKTISHATSNVSKVYMCRIYSQHTDLKFEYCNCISEVKTTNTSITISTTSSALTECILTVQIWYTKSS